MINNAGIGAVGTVEDNDDAEWARVLDINVVGMARVSAAALPYLRRSSSSVIVNACSVAALNGLPLRALYSASKGAVLSLTLAIAADHVADGVRVNAVCPGTRRPPGSIACCRRPTIRMRNAPPSRPVSRWAGWSRPTRSPTRSAICASPLSASTTGTVLDVDGGLSNLRVRPAAK